MEKVIYGIVTAIVILSFNGCGAITKAYAKTNANNSLKTNGIYKLIDKSIDIDKLPKQINVNYITEIKIVDKENKKLTYLHTKVSEDGKILKSTKHLNGNYFVSCRKENICSLNFRAGTKQINGKVSIKLDNKGNLSKYDGKLLYFEFLPN